MITAAPDSRPGLKITSPRVDEIYRANIGRLVARGSYTPPARAFPGARYIPPGESPESDWEQVRELWSAEGEQ